MSVNQTEKIREEAKALVTAIYKKIQNEFERFEKIHYNQNTKGADYEKVVASMLINDPSFESCLVKPTSWLVIWLDKVSVIWLCSDGLVNSTRRTIWRVSFSES